jgi:hypothetical protein
MIRFASMMAVVAVAALTVGTAAAQSPHFLSGPTCADNGTTLTCTGTIAGLGNASGNATVTLSGVTATATTECTSPGGNVAPGQTKTVAVGATGTFAIDKNGRVTFSLTTGEVSPGGCPNRRWIGTVTDVSFDTSNLSFTVNGQPVQ